MSSKSDLCTRHKGEPVTVYSLIHERCMCLKCAMTEHDQLTDFVPISEGARKVRRDGKDLLDEIKSLSDTAKQIRSVRQDEFHNMNLSEKKIKANMRKLRDQLNRKLDLMEQRVVNKVKLTIDKHTRSFGTDQHSLTVLHSDLNKMSDRLSKTLNSASDTELIRTVIVEKNALQERKSKVRQQEEKHIPGNIALNISPLVQNFLDASDELGEVIVDGAEQNNFMKKSVGFIKPKASLESMSLRSVRDDEQPSPHVRASPSRLSRNKYGIHAKSIQRPRGNHLIQSDDTLVNFVSDEDYMIKTGLILLTAKHETSCCISGITSLSNGRVVVCDSKHKCIQLLNRRSKVIDYLICRNKPCDVDSISDNSVVFSFYEKDFISIFNVSDYRFIHVRDLVISGRGGSYSISHDNGKFAVCRRGEVKIISGETGRLINTVEIDSHFPQIVMADSKLYLSDFVGGKVICMTDLGKIRWEYGQDEFEPSSLALDLNKLFISDIKGVVTILSTYGVLLKAISCPGHLSAMCVDSWEGTILVSQESKDRTKSRELKIIQI